MTSCSDVFHGPTVTFHSGHLLTVTPCCTEPAPAEDAVPKSYVDAQAADPLPQALRLPVRP